MGMTAAMCLQYPVSRGTIHIKSADPKEHPAVDPNFLSHPADAAVLAAGMKVCRFQILHKEPQANFITLPVDAGQSVEVEAS